jgi:hypothetical protein
LLMAIPKSRWFRIFNIKTKLLFCADLLATAGHIPVPYVMVMIPDLINHAEKNKILNAAADNYYLF